MAMAATTPADVKEYSYYYEYIIDTPGLKSGDIKVQVMGGNMLVISGERKREEKEGVRPRYMRKELPMGKFRRKLSLPKNADTHGISTVCKDGVLTVTVKKLKERKKPQRIEVRVNFNVKVIGVSK